MVNEISVNIEITEVTETNEGKDMIEIEDTSEIKEIEVGNAIEKAMREVEKREIVDSMKLNR